MPLPLPTPGSALAMHKIYAQGVLLEFLLIDLGPYTVGLASFKNWHKSIEAFVLAVLL